ncbi:hypothetical protein FOCC_FOCC002887 [Frankliniella occidentalis]|nr:hypothetical protein FOCC_FOCC002887 [Frankliniella occidentalis]
MWTSRCPVETECTDGHGAWRLISAHTTCPGAVETCRGVGCGRGDKQWDSFVAGLPFGMNVCSVWRLCFGGKPTRIECNELIKSSCSFPPNVALGRFFFVLFLKGEVGRGNGQTDVVNFLIYTFPGVQRLAECRGKHRCPTVCDAESYSFGCHKLHFGFVF